MTGCVQWSTTSELLPGDMLVYNALTIQGIVIAVAYSDIKRQYVWVLWADGLFLRNSYSWVNIACRKI